MENFIVSARKYRPADFKSVVGQQHITSTLQNAIDRGQLAHAYLFCGPRGVGKTTCARIVAKTINCMNRTAQNEACDECESCKAFNDGTSFNVHEMDAASNTSVENIRSLNDQVRIPPQNGKYSVYIIDEVHMLSTSAFNAFLKTLEEPPAHVIFILATTEKHKILPTILSRCQIYDFKRITIEDVVKYLQYISSKEAVSYDDESLHMIAQKADGCMRDALSMYDKVVSFCGSNLCGADVSQALNILDYDTYFYFTDIIKSGDYQQALLKYDEVLQRGFDTQTFVGGFATHLRNLLIARGDSTQKLLEVTGNVAQRYKQQATQMDIAFVFNALDLLSKLESSLKTTLNQRLVCELALLKIANLSGAIVAPSPSLKPSLPEGAVLQRPESQQNLEIKPVNVVQLPPETNTKVQTPEVASQPELRETETLVPTVVQTPKKEVETKLGIPSIKNLRKELKSGVSQTDKQEEKLEDFEFVRKEDENVVLQACVDYSEKIINTKPRISIVLGKATISNGKIHLVVPSSLLEEEIVRQKYELLSNIKDLCSISGLDFEVEIDDTVETATTKKLYIKTEDKKEYLQSVNPKINDFIAKLDLHNP